MAHNRRVLEIKAAFRDLIKDAGGQDRAALIAGLTQSKISEAASVNHLDRGPRVDHVAALEAETQSPRITKLLAEFAGCELVPLGTAKAGDPHVHLARIIKESGDVTAHTSQALADGKISAKEAAALKREAREAIEALQTFVAQMSDIIEAGDHGR